MDHKVLIFGNTGQLGHLLSDYLQSFGNFQVDGLNSSSFDAGKCYMYNSFDFFDYDIVINCAGIINKLIDERDADSIGRAIQVNSFFPHWLAERSKKLIHISTDCVFGADIHADYKTIQDNPDATEIYGRSKLLGEPRANNTTVVRTSFIGPEIKDIKYGLFEFVNTIHKIAKSTNSVGKMDTFRNHYWTGVTSLQLSKYIKLLIEQDNFNENRLIHYSTVPYVSKGYVVSEINSIFEMNLILNTIDAPIPNMGRLLMPTLSDEEYKVFPSIKTQLFELKKYMKKKDIYDF